MELKTPEEFREEGIILSTNRTKYTTDNWLEFISDILVAILAHMEKRCDRCNEKVKEEAEIMRFLLNPLTANISKGSEDEARPNHS